MARAPKGYSLFFDEVVVITTSNSDFVFGLAFFILLILSDHFDGQRSEEGDK
jgi:hypothetical protein